MVILTNPIKPPITQPNSHIYFSIKPNPLHLKLPSSLTLNPVKLKPLRLSVLKCSFSSSDLDIDMVRTRDGTYAPNSKKVVVLWDLDNKPPRGPPYDAAIALKSVAQKFGDVIDMSAYANRHAFIHLPQWVVQERRERRHLDYLERKDSSRSSSSSSSDTYICSVCGRKCKSHVDLKKHFKQLHERERNKKLGRMRALKGKKRLRFKERFIDGNEKYNEAARKLLTPKVGYGLAQELKRAGVFVKTVQDKPQSADWALKRQMVHSMSRGVDWIVLVSDDSDFSDMLRKAREANLGTVVVGDRDGALGRHADVWVPWTGVQNGEIKESDLELKRNKGFSFSEFDGALVEDGLDEMVIVGRDGLKVSAFSEGEDEYEDEDDWLQLRLDSDDEDVDYFSDEDDEEF